MNSRFVLAAVAALGAGVAVAGPHLMERADNDGDGFVSLEEFRAAHEARVEEHFARLDTDSDGLVSQAEIESARAAHHDKRRERHQRRVMNRPERLIGRLDVDGSGSVSLAEFDGGRFVPDEEAFYAVDADGSGELNAEELSELFAQHRAAHKHERGQKAD